MGEQAHADWQSKSLTKISSIRFDTWKSLPERLSRLVFWSTQDEQERRWDLGRIMGELSRLIDCMNPKTIVSSAELIAEELAVCAREMKGYQWDIDRLCANLELPTGFAAEIRADESTQTVEVYLNWTNTGERKFESVRKYIGTNSDKCAAALTSAGWKIMEKSNYSQGCRISASKRASEFGNRAKLNADASAIDEAVKFLRF